MANDSSSQLRRLRILLASASMLMTLLGGCASAGNPRDPLEPMNRAIYSFNDGADKAVFAREFTQIVGRFENVQLIIVYLAVTGLLLFLLLKWLVRRWHGRAEIVLKTGVAAEVPGREPV